MAHRGDPVCCRVCSTGPCYDDELVAPCDCRGQFQWVHTRCLEALRAKSDDPHTCELCRALFRLPPRQPSSGQRRRRAWWQPLLVVGLVAAAAVGVFVWAERSEQRRQARQRRREARERRQRMREQRQLLQLVEKEINLVMARMSLLTEAARQGKLLDPADWEGVAALLGGAGANGAAAPAGPSAAGVNNGGGGGGSSGATQPPSARGTAPASPR